MSEDWSGAGDRHLKFHDYRDNLWGARQHTADRALTFASGKQDSFGSGGKDENQLLPTPTRRATKAAKDPVDRSPLKRVGPLEPTSALSANDRDRRVFDFRGVVATNAQIGHSVRVPGHLTRADDGIVLRRAIEADAGGVAVLLTELGYPTTTERARSQILKGTSLGSAVILVEDDRQIVGFVSIQISYQFAEDERFCQLSAIAVASHARRRGLGRRLVQVVEAQAAAVGCSNVRIASGKRPERTAAHLLYARLGYKGTPAPDHVDYVKLLNPTATRRRGAAVVDVDDGLNIGLP